MYAALHKNKLIIPEGKFICSVHTIRLENSKEIKQIHINTLHYINVNHDDI